MLRLYAPELFQRHITKMLNGRLEGLTKINGNSDKYYHFILAVGCTGVYTCQMVPGGADKKLIISGSHFLERLSVT